MLYKDDAIKNSNVIHSLLWMINLKSSNTNQTPPFVSFLFAKAIAEYNFPLEQIKNKVMLAMVEMVKESDEKLMYDTI